MKRNIILLLCLVWVMSACGASETTEESSESSAAERPTLPPTWTPPGVPTHIFMTSTEKPTAEHSPTPTDTPEPTITRAPTWTQIPTVTPVPTFGPSPTPFPTSPPDLEELEVGFTLIAEGLDHPTGLAQMPGTGWWVVINQGGGARIVDGREIYTKPFMEISGKVNSSGAEQGLLGIAFHPRFTSNRYVYVNYSDNDGHIIVERYTANSDRLSVNVASATEIIRIPHPGFQHNGGGLVFGPDGYLYIGVGDGGGRSGNLLEGDPGTVLRGTILRIDVDRKDDDLAYAIPPDNPFAGQSSRPQEIWQYGLRNPWRFSFDRQTGDLYIGDVGEDDWEEINYAARGQAGLNFGWPVMEGSECYDFSPCDPQGLVLPIAEHDHSRGCSVTGGYVYRGSESPALRGIYIYADFCSGDVYALTPIGDEWQSKVVLGTGIAISSFAEDAAGELYVTDYLQGRVLRMNGFQP